MNDFRVAKKQSDVSPGESVRILRELQEMSRSELSKLTGMPQSTISAIENEKINLGVERAKVIARALKCHPAVLAFPGWDVSKESAAYPLAATVKLTKPWNVVSAQTKSF